MTEENKRSVMSGIINIENNNVSPNISPNSDLNRPNVGPQFIDVRSRRILYYLDYLLKRRVTVLTGARNRIYKGMHVLCDDERKTCKFKILDNEIEARGDCFFQSALYNLGKTYFGPRGNAEDEEYNKQNAINFRQLLVNHYLQHNPPTQSIMAAMNPFVYTDSEVIKSYAHMFNRNVCLFDVLSGSDAFDQLAVELFINKHYLRGKIDFFIRTFAPAHYTTLKRIPGFRQEDLMISVLNYEIDLSKYGGSDRIKIFDDLGLEDNIDLPRGTFHDTIRHYEIGTTRDVYRLFELEFPNFSNISESPIPGSPTLSPKTLAGLSEQEQIDYLIKKTDPKSKSRSKARKTDSKVPNPEVFGTVEGVKKYVRNGEYTLLDQDSAELRNMTPNEIERLRRFRSKFRLTPIRQESSKGVAPLRPVGRFEPSASPRSRSASVKPKTPRSASPRSRSASVKPKTPRSERESVNSKLTNLDLAQLLGTYSPSEVEQITGKKLSGLPKPSKNHKGHKGKSINGPKTSNTGSRAPRKRIPEPAGPKAPAFSNGSKFERRTRSRSPGVRNSAARPGFFSMFGVPRMFTRKKK